VIYLVNDEPLGIKADNRGSLDGTGSQPWGKLPKWDNGAFIFGQWAVFFSVSV